jgi:pimeloyl-ACP methyl ester carboxylesterase
VIAITQIVRTATLEIAYEESGPTDGAAVVAVHGWPDSPRTWDAVLPALHARGCRVYRPYLRGFGPTRFRGDATRRSGQIAALCLDLSAFITELKLEQPVVVGHDWGGRAAYALCALEPEIASGLAVMSVAYGSTGPAASVSPEQAHAYWYQWYFSTALGRRALETDARALCRYLWTTWSPSWRFTEQELDETASSWDNPDFVDITVHSYSQRWGEADGDPALEDLEARLADAPPIGTPTIVLHGEEDGGTLVSATAHQERLFTSSYERRTLPGVGHFVPREAPQEVADAILGLAGIRP